MTQCMWDLKHRGLHKPPIDFEFDWSDHPFRYMGRLISIERICSYLIDTQCLHRHSLCCNGCIINSFVSTKKCFELLPCVSQKKILIEWNRFGWSFEDQDVCELVTNYFFQWVQLLHDWGLSVFTMVELFIFFICDYLRVCRWTGIVGHTASCVVHHASWEYWCKLGS